MSEVTDDPGYKLRLAVSEATNDPIYKLRLALLTAVEHLMEAGQPDDLEVFLGRVADALHLTWCDPRMEKWRLVWRLARDRK